MNSSPVLFHKADNADITLLLEGTYPYVRGGVSSWVHELVCDLSEFTFSLVFLGSSRDSYGPIKYEMPENVVHLEAHYLMEPWQVGEPAARQGSPKHIQDIARIHKVFKGQGDEQTAILGDAIHNLMKRGGLSVEDFLYSRQSWEYIKEQYTDFSTEPSFLDYFWTVRIMHMPLFRMAEIARSAPASGVLHTISTGYAGFIGALLHKMKKSPLIISEHGIYTKERKIDLSQAQWIKDAREVFGSGLSDDVSYIRRLWTRFFEGIGKVAYAASDTIISLYEANRQRQIIDGADADRTRVICNGINVKRYAALREQRPQEIPPIMGLIGRVVEIKDIKTFIRSMSSVCNHLPKAEAWIIGPEEEDEDYAEACRALVDSLGMSDHIKFLGFRKIDEILPQLGLLMLTSISEAQPLVLLEAFASGVPAVVTDVGNCRELIEGGSSEDRALGAAGAVVSIANPEATAKAALELLTDQELWYKAQDAAIKRVERYYNREDMFDHYRGIYNKALGR